MLRLGLFVLLIIATVFFCVALPMACRPCVGVLILVPPVPVCSDEIYALSVFKQQARFNSAILLAQQLVPAAGAAAAAAAAAEPTNGSSSGSGRYSQEAVDTYVHMVYGLSKDWCGSGLRVGLLYSRNQRLQQVRRGRGLVSP